MRAVIWAELDGPAALRLVLTPALGAGRGAPTVVLAHTVQVHGSHYVWFACEHLLPDTWYAYEIFAETRGSRERIWPDSKVLGLSVPSAFRTLPLSNVLPCRISFGSCRAGIPPGDPRGAREGLDALLLYAENLLRTVEQGQETWPRLFLFTGDQIYGDEPLSSPLTAAYNPGRGDPPNPSNFEQYAAIYREAWAGTPQVRWMLSCIPSFMIFDDHEIIDDWNISEEWFGKASTPRWRRKLSDGLLAYWVYQGSGNLSPAQWLSDSRMRPLISKYAVPFDATGELTIQFDRFVRRSTRARWLYSVDIGDTRLVIADSRMSRKLTGRRLMMDDQAWNEFVALAKDRRSRKVVLVLPGPFLLPHPLHDLLSRAAESIEQNPPSGVGAIVGGAIGGLLAGPAGAVVGAFAGAFGAEVAIDHFMPSILEHADAELWSAFPSSFDRMLSLLEDLADGTGTTPKSFIGLIGGDIHHSNLIRGDLLRTRRPASVFNFTVSPLRRVVSPEDAKLLKILDGGTWYLDLARAVERPAFVDEQMERLDWYPVRLDGSRPSASALEEWDHFGQFIAELDVAPHVVDYRYLSAVQSGASRGLVHLGGASIPAI